MATSGSKTVKVTGNHTLRFEWSQSGSQSVSGNYTNIYWELYVDTDAYGGISLGGSQSWSVTIDGTTTSGSDSGGFTKNSHKLLGSGTTTVYHNSDGSKTFSFSFEKTFGFTWGGAYRGNYSGSGNATLPTIPRASGLSVFNGSLGTTQTISADRKSSSFTHTLTWTSNGESGTIADKSSATSWNFTPPLELAKYIPSGTSLNMQFTLTTYNGGTAVGSASKTVSMSVPDTVVPNIGMTVEDATTCFAELGKYLQYQSRLKIHVTGIGIYGSEIKAFEIKADGVAYNTTRTHTSAEDAYGVTTGVLQSEGSQKVTATITDTRGRKATITANIEIQSYNTPRITELTVHRCNADGTENQSGQYAKVTYSFSVSSASSGTPKLKYKKSTETTWTVINLPGGQSATGLSRIFPADDGSAYDIELEITDSYGTATRRTTLSTGYTIMHFPASGKGVTFGGVATGDGFNVHMPAHFKGGVITDILTLDAGNCDTIRNSGIYFIGVHGLNRPVIVVGWLSVMASDDGTYCFQEYRTKDGKLWIRYINDSGSWTSWRSSYTY